MSNSYAAVVIGDGPAGEVAAPRLNGHQLRTATNRGSLPNDRRADLSAPALCLRSIHATDQIRAGRTPGRATRIDAREHPSPGVSAGNARPAGQ